jgi:mycoredoxin
VSDVTPLTGADTPPVVMYCRTWCGDCLRARRWLEQRNIPYVEIDVEADPSARKRAADHNEGRLHTPTFEIGDGVCVDFKPGELCELLGIDK